MDSFSAIPSGTFETWVFKHPPNYAQKRRRRRRVFLSPGVGKWKKRGKRDYNLNAFSGGGGEKRKGGEGGDGQKAKYQSRGKIRQVVLTKK